MECPAQCLLIWETCSLLPLKSVGMCEVWNIFHVPDEDGTQKHNLSAWRNRRTPELNQFSFPSHCWVKRVDVLWHIEIPLLKEY